MSREFGSLDKSGSKWGYYKGASLDRAMSVQQSTNVFNL